MSELIYNNESYQHVLTKEFQDSSELEPSGTDEKYIKVRLVVQFVFTSEGNVFPALPNEEPAQTFNRLKESLMTPRKPLSFSNNGKDLINISSVDPSNGPHPQYCHPVLEHSFGPAAWVVEWCVECALPPCADMKTKPFLTCRWSQTSDVDERGYSTLTTAGRATVNPQYFVQGLNPARVTPDTFRYTFLPPLLLTFERKYHYVISENNLEFAFTFTDTEKLYSPPDGFVRTRGKSVLTTMTGGLFYITASSEVVGKKGTSKTALVTLALTICSQKLAMVGLLRGVGDDANKFTFQMSLDAEMETDTVRCMIKAKAMSPVQPGDTDVLQILDRLDKRFETPSSAVGDKPLDVGPGGFAQLRVVAAALGDPCTFDRGILGLSTPNVSSYRQGSLQPPVSGTTSGVSSLSTASFVRVLPASTQPLPPPNGWDTIAGVTEAIHIETSYPRNQGIVVLPVAGSQANGNTIVAIALNNPVMMKTFSYSVTKIGSQPLPPDVRSLDPNLVLLNDTPNPCNINQEADGKLKYVLSGSATYAILNPDKANIAYPLPPWMSISNFAVAGGLAVYPDRAAVAMPAIDPSSAPGSNFLFPRNV